MIERLTTTAALTDQRLRDLQSTLALAGWEARDVNIDIAGGHVVVELHRHDGRWVRLWADRLGRACVERFHRERIIERCFGDGPERDGFRDVFLGRTRAEGPRAALRSLTTYVAENPAPGFVGLLPAGVRRAFAPLMAEAVTDGG